MASGSYKKADVRCPFYRFDNGQRKKIACEGLTDSSVITLVYRKQSEYLTQINEFCCKNYTNCEIYRMLMQTMYEEE